MIYDTIAHHTSPHTILLITSLEAFDVHPLLQISISKNEKRYHNLWRNKSNSDHSERWHTDSVTLKGNKTFLKSKFFAITLRCFEKHFLLGKVPKTDLF